MGIPAHVLCLVSFQFSFFLFCVFSLGLTDSDWFMFEFCVGAFGAEGMVFFIEGE